MLFKKTCPICEKEFEFDGADHRGSKKYCSAECCRESMRRASARYRLRIKSGAIVPKECKKQSKDLINETLAECKTLGISYAQRQMMNTLKMIKENKQ